MAESSDRVRERDRRAE